MKKNKYNIKVNKELINKLKPYYATYRRIEELHWQAIQNIEREMSLDLGIKDLEFFFNDGECAGIGNGERTMRLIHTEELK
jgi:hypothetical protein